VGGDFDLEVELAVRFHWPPQVIADLTDAYLDELIARLNADSEHAEKERRRQRREARRGRRGRPSAGWVDEDVGLDEIGVE
jgi:hypothetical protein